LDIALGSLAEVEYALEVALELNYVKPDAFATIESQQRRAQFLTWKLKTSMN